MPADEQLAFGSGSPAPVPVTDWRHIRRRAARPHLVRVVAVHRKAHLLGINADGKGMDIIIVERNARTRGIVALGGILIAREAPPDPKAAPGCPAGVADTGDCHPAIHTGRHH